MTDRMLRRMGVPLLVAVLLAAAGCGGAASAPSGDAARKQAESVLVRAGQLPTPYRAANGQDYPGELRVCGVRLEPSGVRGFAMKRYARTVVGPFLYEFVYVGSDAANHELVKRVERRLRTCSRDRVATRNGSISYDVTALQELPQYGQASVGLRLEPRTEGVTSEYLLIQRGDVLVLLFSVAAEGMSPPRRLLTSGAAAVTRQLGAGP